MFHSDIFSSNFFKFCIKCLTSVVGGQVKESCLRSPAPSSVFLSTPVLSCFRDCSSRSIIMGTNLILMFIREFHISSGVLAYYSFFFSGFLFHVYFHSSTMCQNSISSFSTRRSFLGFSSSWFGFQSENILCILVSKTAASLWSGNLFSWMNRSRL